MCPNLILAILLQLNVINHDSGIISYCDKCSAEVCGRKTE